MVSDSSMRFPIGKSAYNPIEIINKTGSTDLFSARVWDEVYSQGDTGVYISSNRVRRSWDISKQNPNGGNGVDLTFHWNSGEENTPLSSYKLFHYEAGSWVEKTGAISKSSSSLTFSGYGDSFSPFYIGGQGNTPLPVMLSYFTVHSTMSSSLMLEWETLVEINNYGFHIARSEDMISWNVIGWVNGQGNTSSSHAYLFEDREVKEEVLYYYRLVQEDLNGVITYGPVTSARLFLSTSKAVLSFYPNPVDHYGELFINVAQNDEALLSIVNSIGQIIKKKQLFLKQGSNYIPLNMYELNKGIYSLVLETSQEKIMQKFIKQ